MLDPYVRTTLTHVGEVRARAGSRFARPASPPGATAAPALLTAAFSPRLTTPPDHTP
jgi:hypothetical protein